MEAELGRVAPAVSTPLLGEIRLAWWREGVEALGAGPPRSPVLAALEPGVVAHRIQRDTLIGLIEARGAELEEGFADEPALMDFIDKSQGGLMLAAAQALDPTVQFEQVKAAARAYALARLPERWRPESWKAASPEEEAAHLRGRISLALGEADEALKDLPTAAFPAVAHATLARTHRGASGLEQRFRLLWAVLRGRI